MSIFPPQQGGVFGGANIGSFNQEGIDRRRAIIDGMLRQPPATNVVGGLGRIAEGLVARRQGQKLDTRQQELDDEFLTKAQGLGVDADRLALLGNLDRGARPGFLLGLMDKRDAKRAADAKAAAANATSAKDQEILGGLLADGYQPEDMAAAVAAGATKEALARLQSVGKAQGGGAGAEFGLTPQFFTRPDGSLGAYQLSKTGQIKEIELPEGALHAKGIEKLDLGTHFQWYNRMTGQTIGEAIPKDLAGAEAAKTEGRETAQALVDAQTALPTVESNTETMISAIDNVINDPGLEGVTGMIEGRLPARTQAQQNTLVKIEQLQGKAFLQAFETLKGGGQITEREGIAAQNAIARLQRTQSLTEYKAALQELRDIVVGARDRARKAAQGSGPANLGPRPQDWVPPGWDGDALEGWQYLPDSDKDRLWELNN